MAGESTFHEYQGDDFKRSKAYVAIERYLSSNSSNKAKRLKANVVKDCEPIVLSMDDYEEVQDEFKGIQIWCISSKTIPPQMLIFSHRNDEGEKRYYKLTCKREHRDIITKSYVQYVLNEGKAIAVKTRQRKLYTNNKSENWYGYRRMMWSHIIFKHPSTFDTIAMDPTKKNEILNDLITFTKSKDYYKKVGKSWKQGYLLYSPPGTGKSSMIAAMANLLEYDIYDLELTSVKDNTDLRKLLIQTSSKSIMVIEDIDCSLDLTRQRKEKKDECKDDEKHPIEKKAEEGKDRKNKGSEVTLSGLLNFIDGLWSACGSMMAGGMFVWAIVGKWFPKESQEYFEKYFHKIISYIYPYIEITFHEYQGDDFERSKAYVAIERYLSSNSSNKAKRLKANVVKDCEPIVLSMDDYEEVQDDMDDYEEVKDEFKGIQIWWTASKTIPPQRAMFSYRDDDGEKRYYKLTCKREHRDIITKSYVQHVLDEGKAIAVKTRQRKLYTNNKSESWSGYRRTMWSHIIFEHPSTFDTLAMDPTKKKEILNDLITFTKSKDYYKKVGKSWKRGYLLFGPPGTGKSNLRKLLIETSSKSIIVIEDIDCSLDLTGQRKEKKDESKDDEKDPIQKKVEEGMGGKNKESEVTLSGLLNFIDGLWSACGSERLIVFTTNHVEMLDPALIRRGRMDKHIELSYCCFETFKVLAKNYLDIESHDLFATIERLVGETNMTPADVAESLMPKSDEENADTCLTNLIKSLEDAKEEARLKVLEDARLKAEEEASKKSKLSDEKAQAGDHATKENSEKEQAGDAKENGEKAQAGDAKENGVIKT
ncbi:AAA+ ATPase domain-containing protein [Artemisia annua]|uniref:AAA+ ATPase domain-containing protein n=1 Tax=Artemisia annua TaxID=35608 RepID=A0A2U1QF21_ARTAN|nr:AAA+ ATPase domain-containing protein [Artemisia annua]